MATCTVGGAETVADVARRYPETVEIMTRMGINHCCGAHLTLTEAAAAAGLAVDDVLRAINAVAFDPHSERTSP